MLSCSLLFSQYYIAFFSGIFVLGSTYNAGLKKYLQWLPGRCQIFLEIWQWIFHLLAFYLLGMQIPGISVWGMEMDIILNEENVVFPALNEKLWYLRTYYFFYLFLLIITFFDKEMEKRKEMLAHHIATIFLMTLAGFFGYIDVSVYVLYVNNIADVFLGPSKILDTYKSNFRIPFFLCFAAAHLILRCIYFPINIVRFTYHKHVNSFLDGPFLLCFPLIILNYYWAYRIGRICLKFFKHPNKRLD